VILWLDLFAQLNHHKNVKHQDKNPANRNSRNNNGPRPPRDGARSFRDGPRPPRDGGGRPPRRDNFRDNDRPRGPRTCPDLARNAAAMLVWLVADEKQTLDEAMQNLEQFASLDGRDRGFAAMVAKSTLRYFGHIEDLLASQIERPLPETANFVRALLRTAVGQLLANIAPPHAIIDRAVSLAKFDKKAFGMAGLVNAVLHRVFEAVPNYKFDDLNLLPLAWRNRYVAAFGEEKARLIAKSLLKPAPIDLSLKQDLTDEELAQILNDFGGYKISATLRTNGLPSGFLELDSWKSGNIWVQDLAASMPAQLLKPKRGQQILDMCAAPGGKTMQLASYGAQVTAIDVSEGRIKLVAQNLARTNLHAKLVNGDAKKYTGENQWDSILLDAPCSATGTLRRNLETLLIKTPFDLPKLMEIQCELMRAAAIGVKSGGHIVYAVCSMEPEEADLAISAALEAGLVIDKITPDEVFGLVDAIEERGTLRLLPYMLEEKGGLDGFFIARFRKL
jgi:16S rRNA (cytosine967-C5)-methyltransferase